MAIKSTAYILSLRKAGLTIDYDLVTEVIDEHAFKALEKLVETVLKARAIVHVILSETQS